MNYANGEVPGISEHNIPGIVIPQKVYTANGRPPQIKARVTFSVNHTVGLRLQDAVQTPNFVLDNAASIPVIPDGGQRASFRISVCRICYSRSTILFIFTSSGPDTRLGVL